jgi:hypothetical protein
MFFSLLDVRTTSDETLGSKKAGAGTLSKGNGFLRTDFLTTKAGDTNVCVHPGEVVVH